MSITPNIVRSLELPDKDAQSFWSGTEEAFDVKPMFSTSAGRAPSLPRRLWTRQPSLDTLAKREQAPPQKPPNEAGSSEAANASRCSI